LSSKPILAVSRRAFGLSLVALAGCGFRPLYGTNGAASVYQNAVGFVVPDGSDGYELRRNLEDRFGQSEAPAYILTVSLTATDVQAAVAADTSIARRNLEMAAEFALRDSGGNTVISGSVSAFGGYSNTGTTVSIRAAERDSRARVLAALADLISARINTYAASQTR